MAEEVYQKGLDTDGAVLNEGDAEGRIHDSDKDWWPQAEAVVGFVNAYSSSGDNRYLDAAVKAWHLKVNEWKCPYHNSRACFEIIERFQKEYERS